MPRVHVHGDLQEFLSRDRRAAGGVFTQSIAPHATLKDVLEAAGIPHVEIDRIEVDGRDGTLDERPPQDVERIDVHPHEPGRGRHLLPPSQATPTFILDVHLGRLAALLRMLGFDTLWFANADPGADDAALAEASAREDRTLLTRDVGLLKRGLVRRGAFVRATDSEAQLTETVERFALRDKTRPFSRCLRCNTPLRDVAKAQVESKLPPRVRERQTEFRECPSCHKVYWPGTHHARMAKLIPR